jgi:hypothetical protein
MPFICIFKSFFAASSASAAEFAKSIPPAFPLPATNTWALIANGGFSLAKTLGI